jgi:UDPglucose--hexose-1-phosphate uridylyltransferase
MPQTVFIKPVVFANGRQFYIAVGHGIKDYHIVVVYTFAMTSEQTWERRWHPLRGEWVTITSHRNTRPWSFDIVPDPSGDIPEYGEDCYLCPGNVRVSGEVNDEYRDIYVFDNDHPSFSVDAPVELEPAPGIYRNAPAGGICRVICYSPKHNLTLGEMPPDDIATVIDCWASQTSELSGMSAVSQVLIFENKGSVVGVSNPHPHCQIYASDFVFPAIEQELGQMIAHKQKGGRSLMQDILATELEDGQRVVVENEHAVAFIPYFARFPYETYVVPRTSARYLHELDGDERSGLARVLSETLVRMDNLWQRPFPYMLIVHQAPSDGGSHEAYDCYIQLIPPMRAPGLQKYLAGVESGGGHFLNDGAPEEKADELRAVSNIHYRIS